MAILPHQMVLPMAEWPKIDQELWAAGLDPGDGLDGPAYAAGLRPMTLRNAARAYGRWLAVLAARSALDASVSPALRMTPANAQAYLQALRQAGNSNNTINVRFFDLRSALRIMHPEMDTAWLTSPGGHSLLTRFPIVRRSFAVPGSRELYEWGFDLMAQAPQHDTPIRCGTLYRNGLLIALLAARAPRIRSVAALRLGRHLQPSGNGFRLVLEIEDVKGPRPIEYGLPNSLLVPLRHYLDIVRPSLMGAQAHDWLWVGQFGEPFGLRGIEGMIRRASLARFGAAFGTHRFRHAVGTIAPVANPTHPAAGAALLGSSPAVVAAHYNRGRREAAAHRLQSTLEAQRAETRLLAERLFGQRTGEVS